MRTPALKVKDGFSAFGRDHAVGDIIPSSVFSTWPDGTVENRLKNDFLEHSFVESEQLELEEEAGSSKKKR